MRPRVTGALYRKHCTVSIFTDDVSTDAEDWFRVPTREEVEAAEDVEPLTVRVPLQRIAPMYFLMDGNVVSEDEADDSREIAAYADIPRSWLRDEPLIASAANSCERCHKRPAVAIGYAPDYQNICVECLVTEESAARNASTDVRQDLVDTAVAALRAHNCFATGMVPTDAEIAAICGRIQADVPLRERIARQLWADFRPPLAPDWDDPVAVEHRGPYLMAASRVLLIVQQLEIL